MHESFVSGNSSYTSLGDDMNQFRPSNDYPLFSFDCGWGVGQLTCPVPNSQAVWDWKANINGAGKLLLDLNGYNGKAYWIKHRFVNGNYAQDVVVWNALHPNDKVEDIRVDLGDIYYTTTMSYIFAGIPEIEAAFPNYPGQNYTSLGFEKSLLDACIIHVYNQGAPNQLYLRIKNNGQDVKPNWYVQDNNNNYVTKVSKVIVPMQ